MERENYVQVAKLAEQTERYDDMVEAMKNVADMKVPLTVEERNLLSVAYKNVIGSRRASWRVMCSLLERAEKNDEPSKKEVMEKFQAKIETELSEISKQVLEILENLLAAIGDQNDGVPEAKVLLEAKVFYLKMKGDYQRYMAEIYKDDEKEGVVKQSLDAYKQASDLAQKHFTSTHPIRLGLALNFSVFYFEILNNSTEACKLAKQAFDDAIAELDDLGEDNYKDSTLIMQLLRDNIALWTANENDNVEQEDQ